jgi:hypothetical protein
VPLPIKSKLPTTLYKALLVLTLSYPTASLANASCASVDALNAIQRHNLSFAYSQGAPHDLGYTLAAIALVESNAGQWRLNVRTNDLGLFQINAKTAQDTLGVTHPYRQLELHQQLVYDDRLGAEIAIATLKHFQRNRAMTARTWREMVKSYNGGNSWRRDKAALKRVEAYADRVSEGVRVLKMCEGLWK